MHIKKFLAAAFLYLGLSHGAIADQHSNLVQTFNSAHHCGEGTISAVIVGGWNWAGLHLEVDWNPDRKPSAAATYGGNVNRMVRFLESDLGSERMKRITAASWLAFANEYYVRFASSHRVAGTNEVDCSRATEIQFTRKN